MAASLARDLWKGVRQDLTGSICLGAALAFLVRLLGGVSPLNGKGRWDGFTGELVQASSTYSGGIMFVATAVVAVGILLRGRHKTPGKLEVYLLHPFIALAADAAAMAVGFFLVAAVVYLFSGSGADAWRTLVSLGYSAIVAAFFWTGRAISFKHGNRRIWGTRSQPRFNRFGFLLQLVGLGVLLALGLRWVTG